MRLANDALLIFMCQQVANFKKLLCYADSEQPVEIDPELTPGIHIVGAMMFMDFTTLLLGKKVSHDLFAVGQR